METTTQWTIGEVARRAGLRASALRYYESIGLLPEPARVNGRRLYNETVFPVLAVLQLCRNAGFTIAEMQTLFANADAGTPPAARWQQLAQQKLMEIEAQIAQARQMQQLLHKGLQCGCLRFEDCELVDGEICVRE